MLFFLAVVYLFPSVAYTDAVVGTITDIAGSVFVDAFGTGDFIDAIPGETLYAASVVKTGYGGMATIEVDGIITELAPESTLELEKLLETRDRKKRFRWAASVANAVKSIFKSAKSGCEDVVLGGRAAEVQDDSFGWITEDQDKEAFDEAMEYIESGELGGAVALLREIIDPLPGTFLPGEVDYWIGHCQYRLENYPEALLAHEAALSEIESEPLEPWSLPYYEDALFQFGSSSYFVGEYEDAVSAMESLIPESSDDYKPYAYMIMIDSLNECGRNRSAGQYLEKARTLFTGTAYAADIESLAETFN